MKALMDMWNGNILVVDSDPMIFNENVHPDKVITEVVLRLNNMNLNESHSCTVEFNEDNELVISGDEDHKTFELVNLKEFVL